MAVGYNHLERYNTGCFYSPKVWAKTHFVKSFLLWINRRKGFEASEGSRATVKLELFEKPQMSFVSSQSRLGTQCTFMLVHRGLAISTNSGIHMQQYLAAPRNP